MVSTGMPSSTNMIEHGGESGTLEMTGTSAIVGTRIEWTAL